MRDCIVEAAPAKVNLALAIKQKRPDGYHDLQTVFQTISLYDQVEVRLQSSGIVCNCGDLSGPDNLAYKAASLFCQSLPGRVTGFTGTGVQITINKNIPVQAGLAGGSSDAAAVLRALNKLFSFPFTYRELLTIAQKCGSDTAFCLKGGTQWGEGTGAELSELPSAPQMELLVVKPERGINTAEAYKFFDSLARFDSLDRQKWQKLLSTGSPEEIGKNLFNSFEKIADSLLPELSEIKRIMLEEGCYGALLTGSGSAVFGILQNRSQGEKLLSKLRRSGHKNLWLARTVDSSEIWEKTDRLSRELEIGD